jgi:DNA primase
VHKKYLQKRNFDADRLEAEWDLLGTGPVGDYKLRIIAPITFRGRVVSYQGRALSELASLKYKACRLDEEVIPHKTLLYGLDRASGHSAIVVEGITDVWRLGFGAVATFGVQWTREQIVLLREYPRVFIMYDFGEAEAEEQGRRLAYALAGLGVSVELLLDAQGDPADLSNEDAKLLMREIRGF